MLVRLDQENEITASFKNASFNPANPFTAVTPDDALLDNALLDPGLFAADLALNSDQIAVVSAEMALRSSLRQQQYIVYDIASRVGVLAPFVGATQNALKGFDVILDSLNKEKATAEIITTAIGVAGTTLSAIPTIYTQIAGNLISLGVWIANLFIKYQAEIPVQEPAQEYSKDTDVEQFNGGVRKVMAGSNDWSSIFSPRFSGPLAAQVREDQYGRLVLAFAPGNGDIARVDVTGSGKNRKTKFPDEGTFVPTGGLGMIPGGERILSVVQLTPTENPVGPSHGHATIFDPRCGSSDKARAIDVGSWYPVTSQGALSLWDFLWQRGAAMYTINVPAVRAAWSSYFDSIWNGVVRTWGKKQWKGDKDDYGWGCGFWENALQELVAQYTVGVNGKIGGGLSWRPPNIEMVGGDGALPGSFGDPHGPLTLDATKQWEAANAYDRIIKPALDKLEEAQLWYLKNTTMAAYLPIKGGKNADPLDQGNRGPLGAMQSKKMRDAFNGARNGIINGTRKYDVRLRDVIDPIYRSQIKNAGGGTDALELGFAAMPPGEPNPVPPTGGSGLDLSAGDIMPPPPPHGSPKRKTWPYLVGGAAVVGATAAGYVYWDDIVRAISAARRRVPAVAGRIKGLLP